MALTKLRCASWCGGGCTEAAYQRAKKDGAALAAKLGRSWKPRIWENLGWHHEAVSACGLIKVTGERRSYLALFGVGLGGRWFAYGKSPRGAAKAVLALAWAEEAEIHSMVSMVHNAALGRRDRGPLTERP